MIAVLFNPTTKTCPHAAVPADFKLQIVDSAFAVNMLSGVSEGPAAV